MGRYYTGDIEGKMWFGVQSSSDADFFGSEGYQPEKLCYDFDEEEHIEQIKEGVAKCEAELGEWKQRLDTFFKEVNGYNDSIIEAHGMNPEEFRNKLEWYARLELGKQILSCVEENGSCSFEVEL